MGSYFMFAFTDQRDFFLRLSIFICIMLLVVGGVTYYAVGETQRRYTEFQALSLAKLLSEQTRISRSIYTEKVSSKFHPYLSQNSDQLNTAFLPVPNEFLAMIGSAGQQQSGDLYRYRGVSKWHLNENGGLDTPFLNWAWPMLEAQDQARPRDTIEWQDIWRFEEENDYTVLKYLAAVPADYPACVQCHNRFELQGEIKALRHSKGVETGKHWELHQLIGAMEVVIRLDKVEAIIESQAKELVFWILVVLCTALVFVAAFVYKSVTYARSIIQLSWQATHDALTGLFNRRVFEHALGEMLSTAQNEDREHALCFLDLDFFKAVNDTYGHAAGDDLLIKLTKQLKQKLRESDILARLGGDEFAVLIADCPLSKAKVIANVLCQTVKDFEFRWEGNDVVIGVSIGVVMVNRRTPDMQAVTDAADAACYVAKKAGRNLVHVYIEGDHELIKKTK